MRPTDWLRLRFAAIASLAFARFVTCSSVENEAIWPMNSPSSMGFMGSWCCSWATKSLRNWSLPSSAFFPPVAWVPGSGVPVEVIEVASMSAFGFWDLGEDVDVQAVGELHRLDDGGRLVGLGGLPAESVRGEVARALGGRVGRRAGRAVR